MSKIKVEQSNTQIEEIKFGVISNLYKFDIKSTNDLNYMKGRLHSLGEYEYQIQYLHNKYYPDLIISVDKYYVHFQDPEVERICTLYFASDRCGCTQEDVLNVKFVNNESAITHFKENTVIEYFDDFNKFTNLTKLKYEYFRNCTNLKSVNLENIVEFSYSDGMQYTGVFRNCQSLEKLYLPNIEDVGQYVFYYCTNLKYLICPKLKKIGRNEPNWISGCDSLQYILLGKLKLCSGGDQWHVGIFAGLTSLKVVDLGDNLETVEDRPFKSCTNLKAIIIRNQENIPELTFTSLAGTFGNANVKIFVSDNLLETYKSDINWLNVSNNIYALSTFKLSDYIDFEIPEIGDLYNFENEG